MPSEVEEQVGLCTCSQGLGLKNNKPLKYTHTQDLLGAGHYQSSSQPPSCLQGERNKNVTLLEVQEKSKPSLMGRNTGEVK